MRAFEVKVRRTSGATGLLPVVDNFTPLEGFSLKPDDHLTLLIENSDGAWTPFIVFDGSELPVSYVAPGDILTVALTADCAPSVLCCRTDSR